MDPFAGPGGSSYGQTSHAVHFLLSVQHFRPVRLEQMTTVPVLGSLPHYKCIPVDATSMRSVKIRQRKVMVSDPMVAVDVQVRLAHEFLAKHLDTVV